MIEPEALLLPIQGDVPQGIDLRNPTRRPELYDALAAVRSARQREDAADPAVPPDWMAVEKLCSVILAEHSKDMEAAAGLAEASIRNDGFAGLAAAGTVTAGLIETFWPVLFPIPEEDENDVAPEAARLRPLDHLLDDRGRLLPGVRRAVLFTLDDGTDFTYADCVASKAWTSLRAEERTKRLAALTAEQRAEREQSPGVRLWNEVGQALAQDPGSLPAQTRDDVAAALASWQKVSAVVQAHAGDGWSSCRALLDLLGDILRTMTEMVPIVSTGPGAAPATDEPLAEEMTTQSGFPAVAAAQGLSSREDALRRLDEIAAFFRRTEPYSPVAYTLEEAMRRARLAWPEWLAEAVPDKSQRDAILNRLGLRPDET
jgi:type VI secretion system protein ImpA